MKVNLILIRFLCMISTICYGQEEKSLAKNSYHDENEYYRINQILYC